MHGFLQYEILAKVKELLNAILLFYIQLDFWHQNINSFKQLFFHTKLKKQVLLNSIFFFFFF